MKITPLSRVLCDKDRYHDGKIIYREYFVPVVISRFVFYYEAFGTSDISRDRSSSELENNTKSRNATVI